MPTIGTYSEHAASRLSPKRRTLTNNGEARDDTIPTDVDSSGVSLIISGRVIVSVAVLEVR